MRTLQHSLRCFVLLLFMVCARDTAANPTGFVYALRYVPSPEGQAGAELLIYDGGTAQLVTTITVSWSSPTGIAISPNGAHVYVLTYWPNIITPTLDVIDARRHVRVASYPVPRGELAVRGDDLAVYVRNSTQLWRFDLTTLTLSPPVTVGAGSGLVFDRAIDRVAVPVANPDGSGYISLHDPVSLAEVQRVTLTAMRGLSLSRSGRELLGVRILGSGYALTRLDAVTLDILDDRPVALPNVSVVNPADSLLHSAVYVGARDAIGEMPTPTGTLTAIGLPQTTRVSGITIPSGEKYVFINAFREDPTGLSGLATMDPATRQIVLIDPRTGTFSGPNLLISTPDGAPSCTYRLGSSYVSFTATGQTSSTGGGSGRISLTTECAWQASAADSWVHISSLSAVSGVGSATLTITVDPNVSSSTRQSRVNIGGQLVTVTQAGAASSPAFGFVDTPEDFSRGISGSLAVTGWAMDDVGVAAVHLYRDPVPGEPDTLIPLGDATFVDGARPDVQAIYGTLPFASRAGWGYMLLTNVLPGGGDGTYRLHAYAEDIEGHLTLLGTRTFTASNSAAALPFGAIDTPGQGEVVSGVITNWGWALTPQPANIPVDGSTIDVIIDGVTVGHPTYGLDRPDIAALFPGYANTNSAVGYFTIDTTTLTSGVHTIAWVVRDSMGRAQGIGSRYFTVQNP